MEAEVTNWVSSKVIGQGKVRNEELVHVKCSVSERAMG